MTEQDKDVQPGISFLTSKTTAIVRDPETPSEFLRSAKIALWAATENRRAPRRIADSIRA